MRAGGKGKRERERKTRARSITARRIENTDDRDMRSRHPDRHRGMSHRYRWPRIHEWQKNAKVSDPSDRNKFAWRANEPTSQPAALDLA